MATPPDSPGPEEALFEFESTRARQQTTRPVALEELLRQTKFSRQEIRVMYRGFKQKIRVGSGCGGGGGVVNKKRKEDRDGKEEKVMDMDMAALDIRTKYI
ncbi:hypothetical protein M0802_015965 [Mischocyttarus mexicanus]|nr:hypothetical protein M0802_015965 [Mischocyttarus mexicanus]